MIKVIGIKGLKFSGKDTIAEYLIKKYGFQRYAFADPIKKAAMELFGFTHDQMWGSAKDKESVDPRWNISPRRMLQLMGTELFQYDIHKYLHNGEFNVGRAVWVYRFKLWFEEERKKHLEQNTDFKIVISDVRFLHEIEVLKSMGGTIIDVERPSIENIDLHVSEVEIKSFEADYKFINSGTIEELYSKVDEYLKTNLSYA